jgi:serine/threonine-protein kinase
MQVLQRALSRRRDDRFPTTGAYVDALDEVVRRRRIGASPATLVDWLYKMGLVKPTGRSGEHALEAAIPGASGMPRTKPSPLPPKSSGAQPIWKPGEDSMRPGGAPALYRMLHPEAAGALSLTDVITMLASGLASGNTPVSRDDGPFKPACEHPELVRVCGGGASLSWDDVLSGQASAVSSVGPGELPGRLFDLALRRATGMLRVKHIALEKKVYFVDGVPEVTISTDEKELLGALLVARGLALPMEIEMGLAMAPRYGGRLGDALVGLGVVRPMELVRAVVDQMRRRFVELVSWKEGQLSFTSGARSPEEETMPEAFNSIELITRGIVEGYSYDDLVHVLAPVEHAAIVPLARPPVSVSSLKLPVREAAVLESIAGRQTLSQITSEAIQHGSCDHEGILRAVFIGLSSGAFISPAWPPAPIRESLPTLPNT